MDHELNQCSIIYFDDPSHTRQNHNFNFMMNNIKWILFTYFGKRHWNFYNFNRIQCNCYWWWWWWVMNRFGKNHPWNGIKWTNFLRNWYEPPFENVKLKSFYLHLYQYKLHWTKQWIMSMSIFEIINESN